MALAPTIYTFAISLADSDRGVYESLQLRVARHPSETAEFLIARVIAYCMEYRVGITFSKGLFEPDEPALFARDLTGTLELWIDIGAPDSARLHKAAKASSRVAVYTHRDPANLVRQLAGERIHRAEALEIHAIDRDLVAALASRLNRRMEMEVVISGGQLYITLGGASLTGAVERIGLPAA